MLSCLSLIFFTFCHWQLPPQTQYLLCNCFHFCCYLQAYLCVYLSHTSPSMCQTYRCWRDVIVEHLSLIWIFLFSLEENTVVVSYHPLPVIYTWFWYSPDPLSPLKHMAYLTLKQEYFLWHQSITQHYACVTYFEAKQVFFFIHYTLVTGVSFVI